MSSERHDSIIGCAALLREAERQADIVFDRWSAANVAFNELLLTMTTQDGDNTKPSSVKLPEAKTIDSARNQAVALYEGLLDAQKLKADYAAQLLHLRSLRRTRPSPFAGHPKAPPKPRGDILREPRGLAAFPPLKLPPRKKPPTENT